MVAGGGEMGNAPGVARVLRAALAPRFTCPLCKGYFREANAFMDCRHTFCWECIMKKIDEEEIESCPVCDAALGIAPEEKLRADDRIQAIRDSVFPPKTEVDAFEGPTIPLPAKIEERSISSFLEIPKMAPKSTKMTISANKKKNSADIFEDGKNRETIDKEELYKPLPSLVGSSAKKLQKSSSCLRRIHNNKTTTEHSLRESPEADSHDGTTTPVWFSLVTAPNQAKAKQLPQIENNFYRIKDGTMQVSSILKLIIKKLELASDVKASQSAEDKEENSMGLDDSDDIGKEPMASHEKKIREDKIMSLKEEAKEWNTKNDGLVGRESQMTELVECLVQARVNSRPVMSVWGIAQVGKSALVKKLFYDTVLRLHDGKPKYEDYYWVEK